MVHLEIHTEDLPRAAAFYALLCGWQPERVQAASKSYWALDLGGAPVGGGVVECTTPRALWLPYVQVPDIADSTAAARRLGADVTLEPREGPVGWRSVVSAPAVGEVGLWQPKEPAPMSSGSRNGR